MYIPSFMHFHKNRYRLASARYEVYGHVTVAYTHTCVIYRKFTVHHQVSGAG